MKKRKGYILWLPSWYPNPITPYDGDFIQRHAQAASAFGCIHLFYIIRDDEKKMTRKLRVLEKSEGNLTETIIYYASPQFGIRFLDRLISQTKYWWIYRKYLKGMFKKKGLPELVHVHISLKAGLIARWINKKFGIGYILTEHWTIYLPEAKPGLYDLSFAEQHLLSYIMSDVGLILPVSEYLGKEIKKHWPHIRFEVVPNVVNTEIFFPVQKQPSEILKLIHVSTLSWQKDPESLLKSIKVLKERNIPLRLDIFGPQDKVRYLSKELDIADIVFLHGEVPQPKLAAAIQQSDALVLYSRYETFGCVIIEANACGVPVIVPDTALMHELIEDGKTGMLVQPGNFIALADAIESFSRNRFKFNQQEIAHSAYKYRCDVVGKMFWEIYDRFSSL